MAVVSSELFDKWWRELQQERIDDEADRSRLAEEVFYGFINPWTVRKYSKTANDWWDGFASINTKLALKVRGRLYRTYWAMQGYHRKAIMDARFKLAQETT